MWIRNLISIKIQVSFQNAFQGSMFNLNFASYTKKSEKIKLRNGGGEKTR
jgi:hypothetical protein